jgi:Zn finger protein HypA/HybF involved in hydrogenase expression
MQEKYSLKCKKCKRHVPELVDSLCRKCRGIEENDTFEIHDLSVANEKG